MHSLFDQNGEIILSEETKEQIIKQYTVSSDRQKYIPSEDDKMTDLTCSCGGFLVQRQAFSDNEIMASAERIVGEIPKHKKTRTQKKWRKRWAEKAGPIIMGLKLVSIMRPPMFVCSICGKKEGFYGAIGRNMIKVEPMPEGAKLIYDKDPEIFAEEERKKKLEEERQEESDDWKYSRE